MSNETVLKIEREEPIAIVTLNRPDQMNALNAPLRLAIGRFLRSGRSRSAPSS
jgi:enoyl-CoA hydratase/carnithine racemase